MSSGESSDAADCGWEIDDILSAIAAGESPEIPEDYQAQVEFGREVLAGLDGKLYPQRSVVCFENSFLCGTADLVVVLSSGKVVVIDWKTGYTKRPPAGENLQLLSYAVGIGRELQVPEVECRIVELDQRIISTAIVDTNTADQVEKVVESIIAEAEQTKPEDWRANTSCKYCARKEKCPALENQITTVSVLNPEIAEKMTPEQVGEWLTKWQEKIDIVASLLDHVRGRAVQIIAAGGSVPGWKCKPGRKNRKWSDVNKLREMLPEAFESVPLSVAQLEKKLGKKAIPADLIEETRGNPQLERETS